MEKAYFEEVQSARQARWIWFIAIPFSFASMLPFIYGFYWQIIKGQPWGDKPMDDNSLMITTFLMMVLLCGVVWLLLSTELQIKIDDAGIHYKFFPNKPRWQHIQKVDIDQYEIKKRNFFASGGWGYHYNLFRKLKSMRICGSFQLALKLRNGHRIFIGTQNPEAMVRALKKLMTTSQSF